MESLSNANENPTIGAPSQEVKGFQKRIIGDTVLIRQGAAQSVEANDILIRQGGIGLARATHIEMNAGGSGAAQAETITLNTSSAGVLISKGEAKLDQSAAKIMASNGSVQMEQSAAGILAARQVTLNNSAVVFLVAQNVNGDVKPLFGSKEAAVFGAVAGAVGAGIFLIAKFFNKRNS